MAAPGKRRRNAVPTSSRRTAQGGFAETLKWVHQDLLTADNVSSEAGSAVQLLCEAVQQTDARKLVSSFNSAAAALATLKTPDVPVVLLTRCCAQLFVTAETTTLRRSIAKLLDECLNHDQQAVLDILESFVCTFLAGLRDSWAPDSVVPLRSLEALVHICTGETKAIRLTILGTLNDLIITALDAGAKVLFELSHVLQSTQTLHSFADLNQALFMSIKAILQMLRTTDEVVASWVWVDDSTTNNDDIVKTMDEKQLTWPVLFAQSHVTLQPSSWGARVLQFCLSCAKLPASTIAVDSLFTAMLVQASLVSSRMESADFAVSWFQMFNTKETDSNSVLSLLAGRAFLASADPQALIFAVSEQSSILEEYLLPMIIKNSSTTVDDLVTRNIATATLIESLASLYTIVNKSQDLDVGVILDRYEAIWAPQILALTRAAWDDPADGIGSKIQEAFELMIKLDNALDSCRPRSPSRIESLLKYYLSLEMASKSKYRPISVILNYTSVSNILQLEPCFVEDVVFTLWDNRMTTVCSDLLSNLLLKYLKQCKADHPDDDTKAFMKWETAWIKPLQHGLCGVLPKSMALATADRKTTLRANIVTYLLPPLVRMSSLALPRLVATLADPSNDHLPNAFEALMALLKHGRLVGLLGMEIFLPSMASDEAMSLPSALLEMGLIHSQDNVRIDALGFICCAKKMKDPISSVEFRYLKRFLPTFMTSTSSDFRQRFLSLTDHLLSRLRESLWGLAKEKAELVDAIEQNKKGGSSERLVVVESLIADAATFVRWLLDLLVSSLYPGAPFQRSTTALSLTSQLITVFKLSFDNSVKHRGQALAFAVDPNTVLNNAALAHVLIQRLAQDNFDKNRQLALTALLGLPAPISIATTHDQVVQLCLAGLRILNRPRGQESDGGAMLVRFVFARYVKELRWRLQLGDASTPSANNEQVQFLQQLMGLLKSEVDLAESNLREASKTKPMFGLLAAIRYVIYDVNFVVDLTDQDRNEWRNWIVDVIALVHRVIQVVRAPLSHASPEGNVLVDNVDDGDNEDGDDDEGGDGDDVDGDANDSLGPAHQIINSCCWRSLKEASLVLAALVMKVPFVPIAAQKQEALLLASDVTSIGELNLELLCQLRHLGAISAVYNAFVLVNETVFASSWAPVRSNPKRWLEWILDAAEGQMSVSITRRSAGLPFALLAILITEPASLTSLKTLLPRAFERLMAVAMSPLTADHDNRLDMPQVHAFNMLRAIFRNGGLAAHVLPFIADALMLALNGFRSESWAIRNCATMLFAVVCTRIFGTNRNAVQVANTTDTTTAIAFFQRFPRLHPFLLAQLEEAVSQLETPMKLHASLFPILALLARLQPRLYEADVSSSSFVDLTRYRQLIQACSNSRIAQVRSMASRAFAPLITASASIQVCAAMLSAIPIEPIHLQQNNLHGLLCLCSEVLRVHLPFRISANLDVDDQLKFVELLMDRLWIALNDDFNCPTTRALYLSLLNMTVLRPAQWLASGSVDQWVAKTSLPLQSTVLATWSSSPQRHSPIAGLSLWYEAKATACLDLLFLRCQQQPSEQETQLLIALLSDPAYEVRLVAAGALQSNVNCIDKHRIAVVLRTRLLEGESHHECVTQYCSALLHILRQDSTILQSDVVLWQTLLDRLLIACFEKSSSLSARLCSLPLAGLLTSLVPNADYNQLMKALNDYSSESNPFPLRQAAVSALTWAVESLMTNTQASLQVPIWLVIIRLLQDDDDDIRQSMASLVSKMLHSQRPMDAVTVLHRAYEQLVEAGNQFPVVVYSTLMKLLQTYSEEHLNDLHELLHEEQHQKIKLFYREKDNFYRETTVETQLLVRSLTALLERQHDVLITHVQQDIDVLMTRLVRAMEILAVDNPQVLLESLASHERVYIAVDRLLRSIACLQHYVRTVPQGVSTTAQLPPMLSLQLQHVLTLSTPSLALLPTQ